MNDNRTPDGYLLSKGYSFYVFGLLFLLYMFDYIDRMVVVSLFPYLKADWGLSDAQCGMLVGAVYWSILICSFPASVVVDRWSRKKSIGLMAVIWSLATVACAFTRNFKQLFAARVVIGVGEAGYAPGGTAMISALFPEKKRSMIVGIWNASIPLGMALGILLGGYIATHWGWRHAFGVVAIPGFIVAILFFFVKDYKTVGLEQTVSGAEEHESKENVKSQMSKMDIVRQFTGTPSLLLTYGGFAGMMFLSTSYSSFLPTYFNRVQNMDMQKAGVMTSGILIMAIVGSPLGGVVADWWIKKNPRARLFVPAISGFLCSLFWFVGFRFFEGGPVQYGIFLLGSIMSIAFASSAIAVTQDVVHPGLRAISYALCVITQHMFGSAIGPVATGAMSDKFGITTALTVVPIVSLTSGLVFYLGSLFYERDLAKVERVAIEIEE